MPRFFIAIEPPDSLKQELCRLKASIPASRWLEPEQLHLTVSFLGELPEVALPSVRTALVGLPATPFELCIQGVGCFGDEQHAKVLWAGVAPSEALMTVKKKLDQHLADVGLPVEAQPYRPHITLARFGRNGGQVADFLAQHRNIALPPFRVTHLTLFQSVLYPEGARYHIVG